MSTITLMCSGCLSSMGAAHSSLTPRAAALSQDTSTFRSQDGKLPAGWNGSNGQTDSVAAASQTQAAVSSSGLNDDTTRSVTVSAPRPKARLLPIQFGGHSADNTAKHTGMVRPISRSNTTLAQPIQVKPQSIVAPNSASGHSFNSAAPKIQHSQSGSHVDVQASDGSEANDRRGESKESRRPQWQIPSPSITDSPAPPDSGSDQIGTAAFSESEVPVVEAGHSDLSEPEEERSMLDRIKGLYESPGESSARNIFTRPFQKLQSPWSVFRDKESITEPVDENTATPEVKVAEASDFGSPTDGSAKTLLQQLIVETQAELKNWPQQLSGIPEHSSAYQKRQQDLRLLYLIAERPGEAISSLDSMPPGEQDFWQELMLGMAQYRSSDVDVSREEKITNTVGQLRSAVQHLTPLTALSIQRLEICSRILSYGRIETFPSNDFDPGSPILLYAELKNFGTEMTPGGTYRTSLDAQIQILADDDGRLIETFELSNISDESSSERLDYFQSFELTLPSHLSTGRYQIRVVLLDGITGKRATASTMFQVAPSMTQ